MSDIVLGVIAIVVTILGSAATAIWKFSREATKMELGLNHVRDAVSASTQELKTERKENREEHRDINVKLDSVKDQIAVGILPVADKRLSKLEKRVEEICD